MNYFTSTLSQSDQEIESLIRTEAKRQQDHIELIASENFVSRAVREAQGSILTNKYAEGYPGRRYYGGCDHVDAIEIVAQERAKKLFECRFANVQPHSGSQANQAVFLGLLNPGDSILGLALSSGGHLTHGSSANLSGKWFKAVSYAVDEKTALIDLDQVRDLAKKHSPQLIIAGGSAYTRIIDFKSFREIADEVGAYLLVDMAHFAGLVAAGLYPSPLPYAHAVTTTTHKTLRGPRGGMILTNDPEIAKKINSAIFPGLQGGPLMHVIAAKAVAFKEALDPSFKTYMQAVLDNVHVLGETLVDHGFSLVSGGTDSHVILVDLRPKKLKGNAAEKILEHAGIVCNKNAIPFDLESPTITSGIRLGSPAMTTRGFGREEFKTVGHLISKILDGSDVSLHPTVEALCNQFPLKALII